MPTDFDIKKLHYIKRKFFSCGHFISSDWEEIVLHISSQRDPLSAQNSLLDSTVFHTLNLQYPIKKEYQQNFLKHLISQLESSNQEVCDKLYEYYIDKLNCNSDHKYHYRHFFIDEEVCISLRESTRFVTDGTTGLLAWEGGLALAEWCMQQPSLITSRRVLELGCGLGLTGLSVCASCHPLSYTFTDCHASVLAVLDHNLELNQSILCDTKVTVRKLDWEHLSNSLDEPFDLVLAADVVYDERLFPSLVNTLCHFLCNKRATAILACTERNSDTLITFLQCLDQKGLLVTELECPRPEVFFYNLSPPIRIFSCSHGRCSGVVDAASGASILQSEAAGQGATRVGGIQGAEKNE